MKYDALAGGGIEIGERVPIPDDLVPPDASVEMEAKKAAGYFTPEGAPSRTKLRRHGRPRSWEVLTPRRLQRATRLADARARDAILPAQRRRRPRAGA